MSDRHSGMSEEQRAHILQNETRALERVFRRLANFDKKKDFLKQVWVANLLCGFNSSSTSILVVSGWSIKEKMHRNIEET